jgi:hypothetical protein
MKRIEDLSKSEKVAFLKDVSANKIDLKALQGKPPLFLSTKYDVWIYMSQPRTQVGIAITEEARETLAILNEIIKNQS